MRQSEFHHEAFFYGDGEEFLAGTVPYLRAAIEAGEAALVAVGRARTEALRGELGGDADAIQFADMEAIGGNPARIIPFWRDFLDENGEGERPVRGIGEPVWPGRSTHELEECRRHERLLNVAFDGTSSWSLLCPYDARGLADEELEAAARSHPFVSGDAAPMATAGAGRPAGTTFAGALPPRPADAATLSFDRAGLAAARALVGRAADAAGLGSDRASDLITAAGEVAGNSVAHGGGSGTIWVWPEAGELVVDVADAGTIEEPLVGRRRPLPVQDGGRGLWIANLFCDLVQIRSGEEGTLVRLRMSLAR
jgi:anti-sigma regulatory factor (Ser/Thr protein kinase)